MDELEGLAGQLAAARSRAETLYPTEQLSWDEAPAGTALVVTDAEGLSYVVGFFPVGNGDGALQILLDQEVGLREGWTVLGIVGEVDLATAPALRQRLTDLEQSMERIALDLTGVEFMDSAGLGVLVGCCKRLKAAGGDFAVVTDRPQLARLFEVTGLTEVFGVRATRGELGELVQA